MNQILEERTSFFSISKEFAFGAIQILAIPAWWKPMYFEVYIT